MTPNEIRIALLTRHADAVLALTVWSEARGEPAEGRAAVAWVIKTRAATRHQTIQAACLARNQFSCWWGTDANSLALFVRAEGVLAGQPPGDTLWLETAAIARRVLLGTLLDPTAGADHYLTTTLFESPACPSWAHRMTVVRTIGHHTFLRS
jgi:spore germination cell wall hydrolase CwlJ-like protein